MVHLVVEGCSPLHCSTPSITSGGIDHKGAAAVKLYQVQHTELDGEKDTVDGFKDSKVQRFTRSQVQVFNQFK